jgi:hypothetical protein
MILLWEKQGLKRPEGPERDDSKPMLSLHHDAGAVTQFRGSIVEEKGGSMFQEILALGEILLGWLLGNEIPRPDLAVGMRIGASHCGPFVLKDLNPAVTLAEFGRLGYPSIDDTGNIWGLHLRKRKVMTRGETDHPTLT